MHLRPPYWWYGKSGQVITAALEPIGALYSAAVRLRWAVTTPYRAKIPVICIGNFTAGGAGKTPTAIAVAHLLKALGAKPAFLSRGFGGRLKGPHLVVNDHDNAHDVGDEPLILAGHAPTYIAKDRVAGVRMIEKSDATIIIMDDGFQNPTVEKDLSLVVVDGKTGIGNGHVIPCGPLRAPLSFQLDRANAVLIIGAGLTEGVLTQALTSRSDLAVLKGNITPIGETDWLRGTRIIAFAGIARPEKFFTTLETLGAHFQDKIIYPDHHPFSEQDARHLLTLTTRTGAQLVTTEKDWLRLPTHQSAFATLKDCARVLPIEVSFEHDDKTRLQHLLKNTLWGNK